jgi:hypothetical protein
MMPSERESPLPTCFIVGTGPRLGLAIAERYAREGFSVYALSRRPELLAPGIARLRLRGLRVAAIECEVGKPQDVEREIGSIEAETGSCDVLVYNAIVENGQGVNLGVALACVNMIVKAMQAKGGAAVLFSTCERPETPRVHALVQRLAEEGEAFGIRVGMVIIEGALPASETELASIADRYWDLFFSADRLYERELLVRTDLPRERQ